MVQGTATVGDSIAPLASIPQDGKCTPTGKGLHAPGFHSNPPLLGDGPGGKNESKEPVPVPSPAGEVGFVVVNKEVCYNLATTVSTEITDTNDMPNSGVFAGRLDVCGIVSPGPRGIGAACGSSMGRDGKGKMDVTNVLTGQRRVYDLQDIAWPPALAGVLTVYGHITRIGTPANPTDKTMKQSSKGTFAGVVSASGGGACFTPKPGGAREITVFGGVVADMLGKPAPKPREDKLAK